MVRKWRELVLFYFLRHCHPAILFFYLLATATCATFFSLRQWRGGAVALNVAQVPSTSITRTPPGTRGQRSLCRIGRLPHRGQSSTAGWWRRPRCRPCRSGPSSPTAAALIASALASAGSLNSNIIISSSQHQQLLASTVITSSAGSLNSNIIISSSSSLNSNTSLPN